MPRRLDPDQLVVRHSRAETSRSRREPEGSVRRAEDSVPHPAAELGGAAFPIPPISAADFRERRARIVTALEAAPRVGADLPARLPSGEVASWEFGPALAAALGGAHPKSLRQAPDGSMWMFKPDAYGSAAVSRAESAASELAHSAGMPVVPVYQVVLDGQSGSIQPLVQDAQPISSNPGSWSQEDVDSFVRAQVANWMASDHDGHSGNHLKTKGGQIFVIDQGQSFKYFGSDQLSMSYHPNQDMGCETPLWQELYTAQKEGTLRAGVGVNPQVAFDAIQQYEQIPDTEVRRILHPVAHQGAAEGVIWAPAMRQRAAATLGVAAHEVTTEQIAEAFLQHAVDRKHSLRADFQALFAQALP